MAIVNWKTPEDAIKLVVFLGPTNWVRDLIRGYAIVEKILCNLLREVDLSKTYRKAVYRRIMAGHKLKERWKEEHAKTFLEPKEIITSGFAWASLR